MEQMSVATAFWESYRMSIMTCVLVAKCGDADRSDATGKSHAASCIILCFRPIMVDMKGRPRLTLPSNIRRVSSDPSSGEGVLGL
jgi:hypothetical protein